MSEAEVGSTGMNLSSYAYTRHLNYYASLGWPQFLAAWAPCMWGHSDVGSYVASSRDPLYRAWGDFYASDDYNSRVRALLEVLDNYNVTPEMQRAFVNSVRFEISFWESALRKELTIYRAPRKAIKVAVPALHKGLMVRTRNRLLLEVLEVLSAPYSVLSRLMPQMAAIAIIIAITAYVFMYFQHIDLVSAIYASVGLVTTIGLYTPSLNAMPSSEKLFLTVLVLASVAIYTTIVMNIVSTVTKRTVWIDARARWRASHVKDHVIVLGDMPEVATELDRMGIEYVMVTNNESLAASLQNHKVIIGSPT
ncbi:MAG: hypothetical protein RXO27_04480, partial [Acidilobus sp.]